MPPVNAEMELAVSLLYGSVEIYIKEGDQYVGGLCISCVV
jgi:hypothetical protein